MPHRPIDLGTKARALAGHPRTRKMLWSILGVVALIAVAGFLVAPPIVKHQAEQRLSALLHREVTIERVAINPFVLSATVEGFAVMAAKTGTPEPSPVLAFDQLYARLSYATLVRFAPVLGEMRLVKPTFRLVRRANRTYNVQDLLDEFLTRPRADEPAAQFSLNNVQLIEGRIDFDDRPEGKQHTVTGININVPSVSSLDVHVDRFVQPKFEAVVNGDPVRISGETKPFRDTLETRLGINLQDVDLGRYLDYSPVGLAFTLPSGKLDATLDLSYVETAGRQPSLVVRGDTWVRELAMTSRTAEEVLGFKQMHVRIRSLDVFGRKAVIERVALDAPRMDVRRAKNGRLNLLELLPASASGSAPASPSPAPSFAFEIAEIAVTDGAAMVTDMVPPIPFRREIRNLRIAVKELGNAEGKTASVDLGFDSAPPAGPPAASEPATRARPKAADPAAASPVTQEPARLAFTGQVGIAPVTVAGRFEASRMRLGDLNPYYAGAINGEVRSGHADATATLDLALRDGVLSGKVTGISATLSDVSVHQQTERQAMLRLASATASDGEVDLAARTIVLPQVKLIQPAVAISRKEDGTIDAERLLRTVEGAEATGAAAKTGTDAAAADWSVTVRKLALDGGSVAFEDRAVQPPAKVAVTALSAAAEDVSTVKGAKGTASLRARINRTGSLALNGGFSRALSAKLAVDLRNLDLAPFEPYVKSQLAIGIPQGKVSARGTLDVDFAAELKGGYRGDVTVSDVAVVGEGSGEDLLRWQSLRFTGIGANVQPRRVEVEEVTLEGFYSRLVLDPAGELNLKRLARTPVTAGEPPPASETHARVKDDKIAAAQAKLAEAREAVDWLRVGRVRLEGGNVDFSDFFVTPNYRANLTDLSGTVSSLTFEHPGDVEVRGRLDGTAPVEISGRVNPLAANLFLDLKAAAREIELSPLTPYSVRYLGYGIEKGKLSVNVEYHVRDRRLDAKNNLRLDQLTFGEKVESPDATKLPVLMAVSLLKDRQGVIDVNLPIGGSLDDPKFSVAGIVLRVIINIIAKAVTAPFALLASIAGSGEELSYVEFAAGSAVLAAGPKDKLEKLAKALTERPALKLDIAGRADPEADREGLKRASFERALKQEKYEDLRRAGEAPQSVDAVTIDPKEYPALLERAYSDAKIPDKPRNILGFAKDIPAPEMEKLMLAAMPAGDEDLRRLANERAQAAKDYLVEGGKIPGERLFLVAPKIGPPDAKDKSPATRAEFSLK
jgi:uncharacterized protein involved in outer membrane biogenesis